MTGRTLASALVERGLDPAEHSPKAWLFERVLAGLNGATNAAPDHVWWIPGRLEVFGTHTDYAGGRTLVCAVPKGFAVVARRRDDGLVVVADARNGERRRIQPSADVASCTGWSHYVEVVARRLLRNFPGSAISADLVFASDLPRASGMSSSSALMVGIAAALIRLAELEGRPEWQANIHSSLDLAGYCACLENGMTFGSLQGDAGVGTHGGSEDHAAILMGRPSMLSAFAFVPMRELCTVHVPDDWQFVLTPSGVASEKTGAAQAHYNRLSEGTRRLVELWNAAEPPATSLGSALASDASARERLDALIDRSALTGWPADALRARLDHFIREDARIPRAVDAFAAADVHALSELARGSQQDAEAHLGNQIPATTELAVRALRQGAFASRSFGAGFGGSVWALVERAGALPFAARWRQEAFIAPPGPAMVELDG
jgi:galactokinase